VNRLAARLGATRTVIVGAALVLALSPAASSATVTTRVTPAW
jgi:hypothetical protein